MPLGASGKCSAFGFVVESHTRSNVSSVVLSPGLASPTSDSSAGRKCADVIVSSRLASTLPGNVDGLDVTFGRSRGATVTVDSEKVSRMHARVRRTGDVIEVEDLGSRNGTKLNGDRIDSVRKIGSGDELIIGPIQAVVGVTSGIKG